MVTGEIENKQEQWKKMEREQFKLLLHSVVNLEPIKHLKEIRATSLTAQLKRCLVNAQWQ